MSLLKERKNNRKQLIVLSFLSILSLLIGISILVLNYQNKKNIKIQDEILIEEFFHNEENFDDNKEEDKDLQTQSEQTKQETKYEEDENYIFVLEIPRINIKRGIFSKNSNKNNVNKNIELLKESSMPGEKKGNVILAGHSGNSYVSFFKNLPNLNNNDKAIIYYKNAIFSYKLVNRYEIEKNGYANIIRNQEKETLTLITCKHNTNKQYVFIFELEN